MCDTSKVEATTSLALSLERLMNTRLGGTSVSVLNMNAYALLSRGRLHQADTHPHPMYYDHQGAASPCCVGAQKGAAGTIVSCRFSHTRCWENDLMISCLRPLLTPVVVALKEKQPAASWFYTGPNVLDGMSKPRDAV